MGDDSFNQPRWAANESGGASGFYEAWFIVASDPRARIGLWLRYAVDVSVDGQVTPAIWGAFFDRRDPARTFSACNQYAAAAIRRGNALHVGIGDAELAEGGCAGEAEAGGHSLR